MKNLKIAEIVPLNFLSLTENNQYHMCLAHLALKNETYCDFYAQMARDGKYVLMDNGAAEDEDLWPEDLLKAYDRVNPTEIILPDVLFNKDKTREKTMFFLENYDLTKYKKMIVPQGKDEDEWIQSYKELSSIENIDTIGIPKWLGHANRNSRIKLCGMLQVLGEKREIHLLGLNESPFAISCSNKANPLVRGCDSAFAYLCSKEGVKDIHEHTVRPKGSINFLEDTEEKSPLDLIMKKFEKAAGVNDNSFQRGW